VDEWIVRSTPAAHPNRTIRVARWTTAGVPVAPARHRSSPPVLVAPEALREQALQSSTRVRLTVVTMSVTPDAIVGTRTTPKNSRYAPL